MVLGLTGSYLWTSLVMDYPSFAEGLAASIQRNQMAVTSQKNPQNTCAAVIPAPIKGKELALWQLFRLG